MSSDIGSENTIEYYIVQVSACGRPLSTYYVTIVFKVVSCPESIDLSSYYFIRKYEFSR